MKSQKGMGHVTVFIYMILILLIIGTTIYFAIFNLKEEKAQKHETEMLTIKGKVKILSEESTIKSDESLIKGRKLSENLEDEEKTNYAGRIGSTRCAANVGSDCFLAVSESETESRAACRRPVGATDIR